VKEPQEFASLQAFVLYFINCGAERTLQIFSKSACIYEDCPDTRRAQCRLENFSNTFSKPTAPGPKKGMQLGKAKKANDFLDSLRAEGELVDVDTAPSRQAGAAAAALPVIASDPVSIVIEERLQIILNKDGGMENFEVQGTMSLQVSLSTLPKCS
jgi:hypothetical protein